MTEIPLAEHDSLDPSCDLLFQEDHEFAPREKSLPRKKRLKIRRRRNSQKMREINFLVEFMAIHPPPPEPPSLYDYIMDKDCFEKYAQESKEWRMKYAPELLSE